MASNVGDFIKDNRGLIAVIVCALLVGIGAGYWMSRSPGSSTGKPDQPIEWHAVQAVPTRAPDAEDRDWQGRVDEIDNEAAAAEHSEKKNDAGPDTAPLENASQ